MTDRNIDLQGISNSRTVVNSLETFQPDPKKKKGGNKKDPLLQSSSSTSQLDNKEEDSIVHKKFRIIIKAEESRWELPEDMTKCANNFFSEIYF